MDNSTEKQIIVQENATELSIIQNIHEIRGYRVMLDFDLAAKYEVETYQLKRAVRRNIERFEGEDFMFELTKDEVDKLSRCQIGTLNKGRGANIKYMPFAFTELGVAMLSSVLNSEKAIKVNRDIMRVFVVIRQYFSNYSELKRELDEFMKNTNIHINDIYKILDVLISNKEKLYKSRKEIGFKVNNLV